MTDKEAANDYARRRYSEDTPEWEAIGTDAFVGFLAGAAYKESQMQERIALLESRLARAEDLIKRTKPYLHPQDYDAAWDKIVIDLEAYPTEEEKK